MVHSRISFNMWASEMHRNGRKVRNFKSHEFLMRTNFLDAHKFKAKIAKVPPSWAALFPKFPCV